MQLLPRAVQVVHPGVAECSRQDRPSGWSQTRLQSPLLISKSLATPRTPFSLTRRLAARRRSSLPSSPSQGITFVGLIVDGRVILAGLAASPPTVMQDDISEGIQEPGHLLVSARDWRARGRIDGAARDRKLVLHVQRVSLYISDCKSRLSETMVSISTNMELRGSDFGLVDQLVSWTKMMTGEASQDCSTGQDVS